MWYQFSAYNSERRYGWTRDPAIAEAALDRLNAGKDINLYQMEELSDSEDETGGGTLPLSKRNDHLFDDDTRLEDFAEE